MMAKKIIGIYPWVESLNKEGDKHQLLFSKALESTNFRLRKIIYKKGFPLRHALDAGVDVLILDWVHSFYTSQKLTTTLVKSFLGLIDLAILNKKSTVLIWNLHNLQRHDGKFYKIEKFCFRQLAKKVDYVRVFDASHIEKVSKVLKIKKEKIKAIPQGPYNYDENIEVDLYERYKILHSKNILLFFGSVREGKGMLKFLETFLSVASEDWTLLIAGKAFDIGFGEKIMQLALISKNIVFDNRFIPDSEVKSYFKGANFVTLPYEKTLNSGVLLLSKTYGVPVLANYNFAKILSPNDLVGDLFNPVELKRLLSTAGNKKGNKVTNKAFLWQDVVNQFEKLF